MTRILRVIQQTQGKILKNDCQEGITAQKLITQFWGCYRCAAIERQSTSLTSHPCTCSWIAFICAKCLENAHNPLNMVNDPGKMPNLNMVICRVYVRRRKKNSRAKNE